MAHGLPVYTCNAADFEGIDGLHFIPVRLAQQAAADLRSQATPESDRGGGE
jgi:hypothetical protein